MKTRGNVSKIMSRSSKKTTSTQYEKNMRRTSATNEQLASVRNVSGTNEDFPATDRQIDARRNGDVEDVLAKANKTTVPDLNAPSSDRTSSQLVRSEVDQIHASERNDEVEITGRAETGENNDPENAVCNESDGGSLVANNGADLRRFQNLHDRRKIRKLNNNQGNPQSNQVYASIDDGSSGIPDIPPSRLSTLEVAYNNCKGELRDAKRDKRVYSAFYEAEKRKNEELEKEKAHLSQRVTALEMIVSKKGKRFRKDNGRWSGASSTKSAKEKYEGVFMALIHHINKSASLCVTESYIEENSGFRIRNWTGTATAVSAQTARCSSVSVYLPGGANGIALCPMVLALKREYYTLPFDNISKYVHYRIKSLLESPGFNYMSSTMKDDCTKVMVGDQEVLGRHRHSLSEAVSQRKKQAKVSYIKALGYEVVCKPVPTKKEDPFEEERRKERKEIHERCVLKENENVNTMFWRVSNWDDICKPNINDSRLATEMKKGDADANKGENIDMLFSNHAARLAFLEIRGYELPSSGSEGSRDVSILTLARADAWMSTALDNITLKGKGGRRNNQFSDSFQKLIPIALDAILQELWNDINEIAPDELFTRINNSQEVENDPYGNSIRDYTTVIQSSKENCIYLSVSPKYFKEQVCSWYGDVKDFYIGKCEAEDNIFKRISTTTIFEDQTCGESETESTEDSEN